MKKPQRTIISLSDALLPDPLKKAIDDVNVEEREESECRKPSKADALGGRLKSSRSRMRKEEKNSSVTKKQEETSPATRDEAIDLIEGAGWVTHGSYRARNGIPCVEYRVAPGQLDLKLRYRAPKWYKAVGLIIAMTGLLGGLFTFR